MISEEIRKADERIFWREFLRSSRIVLHLLFLLICWPIALAAGSPAYLLLAFGISLAVHLNSARKSALNKRFINSRFSTLWNGCRERFESFEEGTKKLRRADIAQFQELPETIRGLAMTIYNALRRADILFEEVLQSEGVDRIRPGVPMFKPTDPQAQELYRIAEKNLGEYRSHYNELMAGIQRTEAQATVFMTTLDNLRVKMLGYRLVGKDPAMSSEEFLSVLAEARAQLSAIDQALDELDLSHYPKTVAVIPPLPNSYDPNTPPEPPPSEALYRDDGRNFGSLTNFGNPADSEGESEHRNVEGTL
ncbi:MAG: hypothetical protein GC165_02000 [Armatimonadetes bacterium]|nr:hypothetical protein [Armatimonadota bacterium]MBS1726947.1 hypothetical protein [Armatimonadota bacterium]